jgi:hypothetical protein
MCAGAASIGTALASASGMRGSPAPIAFARGEDRLASALCAAELGEPWGESDDASLAAELAPAIARLRATVPFATLCLLGRLTLSRSPEVRAQVARVLPWLADLYPERVEQLLEPLACDGHRLVRAAVDGALAEILLLARDPRAIIERWEAKSAHPREALRRARRRLPAFDP